ncbi:MAG: SDR family NAD(P)-dependent oxidoreductase [Verrucomicrobia bacterium]|nr:SDR family NAD(P)-dependent oxidoreductase [Verrucomicrobiota bacterium]
MNALITGGAGFIGSHLAEALLARGDSVRVLDDLSTGARSNVAALEGNARFRCVVGDVTDRATVAGLMEECDVVFHLAAAVGVRLVVDSPVRTIETNLRGTEVVLELAAEKNKKVLLTSTSEVYGKSAKASFAETDDLLIGPSNMGRWSYACSKLMDEFLALAYWRERRLPAVVARLFNTVGPRQTGRYGMVIPSFVSQALDHQPITVHGTGKQRRAFAYVADVVGALVALMDREDTAGEVFNVGNDQDISIEELARLVKKMAGSASEIVRVPYEQAYGAGFEDMQRRMPDLSKIKRWVGYEPRFQLPAMLEQVIEFERSRRETRPASPVTR